MLAAAMELRQKKKERLTDEASMFSSVCKPFLLFLLISRQSLVSVAGCLSSVWLAVARFSGGIRSTPFEEDSARNGFCRSTLPMPSKPHATFASVHREQVADGMNSIIHQLVFNRKILHFY
jgi:hypothetical protein